MYMYCCRGHSMRFKQINFSTQKWLFFFLKIILTQCFLKLSFVKITANEALQEASSWQFGSINWHRWTENCFFAWGKSGGNAPTLISRMAPMLLGINYWLYTSTCKNLKALLPFISHQSPCIMYDNYLCQLLRSFIW